MSVSCRDWRQCASSEVLPLLRQEAADWRRYLGWDVQRSWRVIEPARAAGGLPGFVARDRTGRIVGWTWFLLHRGCLQVAALVADREPVVRALVHAVMASHAAREADACVFSIRGAPPGLADALQALELDVARYDYLMAPLQLAPPEAPAGRPWQMADVPAAAGLCARAYAVADQVRAFAPHGTDAEWQEYLHGLLATGGCGDFLPEASAVVDGPRETMAASIVTSLIDREVTHVSQVVVDPDAQGQGLGRHLMRAAMAASVARGARRMTLLVAADNRPARALYQSLGFAEHATFVVASSVQPRRLTSVALATCGASTRR